MKKLFYNVWEPFPKGIHFSITNRCNLNCFFCGQDKKTWSKKDELSLDDYIHVIDQISLVKGGTVSFSGGEIFLHPQILEIFLYCKKKNVPISMVLTNGTLLNSEKISTLLDVNIGHIGFSIDGTKEIHDEVRGVKGSYDKTIAAIIAINEAKKKRGLSTPTVGVNFVIVKKTVETMAAIVDELSAINVSSLRFQYLTYITENKLLAHRNALKNIYPDYEYNYWDNFVHPVGSLDTEALTQAINDVREKAKGKKLKLHFSHNLKNNEIALWYDSDRPLMNNCAFLKGMLILPNGDFPLCDFIRYPIGNVKDKSLKELWMDPVGREFRRMIRRKLLPGCERCCQLLR